ncbi:unnamed protein product, partial [Closterium sp. NIES-54]
VLLVATLAPLSLRGAPLSPFSPLLLLLLLSTSLALRRSGLGLLLVGGAATARARGARVVEGTVGAALEAVEEAEGVAVEVGVVAGVGASVEAVGVVEAAAAAVEAAAAVVEVAAEVVLVEVEPRSVEALVVANASSSPVPLPRWGDVLMQNVAIFDLDFDAILAAMYAVTDSAEGDCSLCVPPYPSIEAAALGASESAAPGTSESATPGTSESAAPGAGESALSGTVPTEALHTFTLDSGASRSFFRDITTLMPLSRPVAVSLADPSGGPVLAHSSTVLSCMASRTLISGLPRSLPPLPPGPAPTCVPYVEGRQRTAPHSSEFPPTEAPLQTLHMDVARRQLSESLGSDLPVLRLHSDKGGEFSSDLLRAFCRAEGIRQTFTLPASPQQNEIGMVMDVARMSMIHAAAPHFLWPFAVQYAAHEINLQPPFVRDTSADKLSSRAVPCVFLGFPPNAPGWQFYHPTSRCFLSSQDVTFDKLVTYYRLFPYRTAPLPPPPLFLAPGAAPVDPLPSQGPTSSGVSQVDPVKAVEVAVDSGAARGGEPGVAESEGAEPAGADPARVEPWGAEPGGAESGGAAGARAARDADPGGAGAGETGAVGGPTGVGAAGGAGAASPGGARAGGTGAGGAAGVVAGDPGAEGTGAVSAVSRGAARPRPYYVPLLQQLQPASTLPGPSPYSGPTRVLTERREPESRPASPESRPASPESPLESPVHAVRTSRRVPRKRPFPVPGTHFMTLRPSTARQCIPLPSPPASSLPDSPDPESDSLCVASPTITRFLATVFTDPSFESSAASALVAELVDFAAASRLDYAASLVAESESTSVCPPSVGAMDTEMASLKSPGTYVDEVPPPGANIINGMWIFRVKRPPGSPPVFKARYVTQGFSQRQGVDFFHTFSPTPKMTTLWVLLHIVAQSDYELHSLDFSTAFLQCSLHEEIWLRRPRGFTGSFLAGTQSSLWRPVYGLRQAPREWHDTLRTTLAALGFALSTADPSLFLCTDTTLPPFYVLVYVDDLVFATADIEALFHVKWSCRRDTRAQTWVLHRFGFTYSSPQSTPLPTGHSLSAPPSDESVEPSGPYPELVGCLMYLMTLQQLVKNEIVAGIRVKGEPDEVLGCPTCMQAKFTRYPFSSSEATAKAPLDEVVMDVVGPLKLGAAGAEYFLTIVDVHTRRTWVYMLSKKSNVAETVKTDRLPMVERQQDQLVKSIRTDRGGEFLSKEDCNFMENLMYKDWKAKNDANIGMRFGEVKSSGLEHVELPLELSSGSTTTRQSSLVNGGEESKDAEEEEEEVQQVSERAPTLLSRTTSAPRIRVTPRQCHESLHVPAAEEEGRGKRRTQAPNRLTFEALGKPAKSALAGAAMMVGGDDEIEYEEFAFALFSPVEMPGKPATLKKALESSDAE